MIILNKVKRVFFVLLFLTINRPAFCQQQRKVFFDTVKNCLVAITDTSFDYSSYKNIDSLTKLEGEVLIIRILKGGDIHINTNCNILCYKNGIWNLRNGFSKLPGNDVGDVPVDFNDPKGTSHKSIIALCSNGFLFRYTDYYYIYVVNKVVKCSYFGNIPISYVKRMNPTFENEFNFFDSIENYITEKLAQQEKKLIKR